jgi:hypothetical protein
MRLHELFRGAIKRHSTRHESESHVKQATEHIRGSGLFVSASSKCFLIPHRQYVSLEPSSFASRGYYCAPGVVVCSGLGSRCHRGHQIGPEFAPPRSHMPPRHYVPPLLPPQQTRLLQPHLLKPHRELRATPRWPVARSHESWPLFCQSANPGSVRGICSVAQRKEKWATKDTSKGC